MSLFWSQIGVAMRKYTSLDHDIPRLYATLDELIANQDLLGKNEGIVLKYCISIIQRALDNLKNAPAHYQLQLEAYLERARELQATIEARCTQGD